MAKAVEDVYWLVTTFLDRANKVADRIPKTLLLHQPICPKSLIIQERTYASLPTTVAYHQQAHMIVDSQT
ncbi:MAG TPA: hypothetical protein VFS97_09045 [Nitrososphaeraceae archaeon]|nr:hypothetical protein [Nitrososphaeraceae archaeon]